MGEAASPGPGDGALKKIAPSKLRDTVEELSKREGRINAEAEHKPDRAGGQWRSKPKPRPDHK
jgi:hypothetical protein